MSEKHYVIEYEGSPILVINGKVMEGHDSNLERSMFNYREIDKEEADRIREEIRERDGDILLEGFVRPQWYVDMFNPFKDKIKGG